MGYVERTKKQGAKLVCGGKIPTAPHLKRGFFFEPTIFTGIKEDSELFQQEAFGPIVCVNKFKDINAAIAMANNSPYALAACVWTADTDQAKTIAEKITAGTVWINTYGMFFNQAPYGGCKQSGFGKELGKEGFLEYTHLKNIIVDKTAEAKPLVSYWYGF